MLTQLISLWHWMIKTDAPHQKQNFQDNDTQFKKVFVLKYILKNILKSILPR